MGLSMKDAWPRMVTPEAPISQRTVEMGDAKSPRGTARQIMVVYSCEGVALMGPVGGSVTGERKAWRGKKKRPTNF